MRKLSSTQKKVWFSILGFCLVAAAFIQFFLPTILEDRYFQKVYANAHLTEKTLMANQGCFHYLEGGKGPTILFVHGFQGDKSYWASYAKELVENYHVIAIDLPAHGKTTYELHGDYDLYSISESLRVFCESLGLNDFHLAGVSMGGGVSVVFASQHPEWVKSLLLLNPLAVEPKEESLAQVEISKGLNPFFPKNLKDLDHLYELLINKYLNWSHFAKKMMLRSMLRNLKIYQVCFDQFMANLPLDDLLTKLKIRTLIIVGAADHVIHPSSGRVIKELMPNAQLLELENGPHTFFGEHLDKTIAKMKEFFKQND